MIDLCSPRERSWLLELFEALAAKTTTGYAVLQLLIDCRSFEPARRTLVKHRYVTLCQLAFGRWIASGKGVGASRAT
jgi:hypothetical protein